MSFSLSTTITRDADPAAAVVTAWTSPSWGVDANPSPAEYQAQNGTEAEATELVNAASEAVRLVAAALGEKWSSASISISGHANPGHGPKEGWANDCLTISVAVTAYA